jgi:methanogen homocitrate synthase
MSTNVVEKRAERGEEWWVSYLNFADEVTRELRPPKQLLFHDVTLRDGEQTPGVVFRKEEKIEIAQKLSEVGVQRIEAGFPVVSGEDADAVKAIARLGLESQIFAMARLLRKDVDLALDCDVSGVICEGSTSDIHLKYRFDWPREELVRRAVDAVSYAKEHGLYTSFMGVDVTRTDLRFFIELIQVLVAEAKLDSVTITDSYCALHPIAFAYFVRQVREHVSVPVELHCHNELGLAVANTLVGVGEGAEVVHVTVNGLGEKTGNAAFEEVAVGARLLYGVDTGLRYEKFYELSKLVETRSRFRLALNKPVVGDYAFARESGLVVWSLLKYPLSVQAYNPELVGNRTKILLGKGSGRTSVEFKLKQLNIEVPDDATKTKIVERVKRRGIAKKGTLTDTEFREIVAHVVADNAQE